MAPTPRTISFAELRTQLKAKKYAPIYILHGEEGYYIDALLEEFINIVPESDRDFNLYTFYAPETNMDTVMDACRRYPMMSDYQVVVLKEAQAITSTALDRLHLYAQQPTPTTILVVSGRGAKLKSKEFVSQLLAHGGVMFESNKLRDRDAVAVISGFIKEKGLNIEQKGLSMLCDYVGTDISRIYNEIDKLTVALPQGSMITPEVIEKHIGISKDYNNFELINALSTKNAKKAFTIIEYFRRDPKNNPFVVTISMVWNFFSNLLVIFYTKDKSEASLCAAIGRKSNWLDSDYKNGIKMYNAWQLIEILRAIREADCKSKGVGSRMDPYDILHDLIYHILTAPGKI